MPVEWMTFGKLVIHNLDNEIWIIYHSNVISKYPNLLS